MKRNRDKEIYWQSKCPLDGPEFSSLSKSLRWKNGLDWDAAERNLGKIFNLALANEIRGGSTLSDGSFINSMSIGLIAKAYREGNRSKELYEMMMNPPQATARIEQICLTECAPRRRKP